MIKWVNYINNSTLKNVEDLNGLVLIQFLENLSGTPCATAYPRRLRTPFHHMEAANALLRYCQQLSINPCCASSDIHEHNTKMIIAFFISVAQKYLQTKKFGMRDVICWIEELTTLKISNFTNDWRDGRLLMIILGNDHPFDTLKELNVVCVLENITDLGVDEITTMMFARLLFMNKTVIENQRGKGVDLQEFTKKLLIEKEMEEKQNLLSYTRARRGTWSGLNKSEPYIGKTGGIHRMSVVGDSSLHEKSQSINKQRNLSFMGDTSTEPILKDLKAPVKFTNTQKSSVNNINHQPKRVVCHENANTEKDTNQNSFPNSDPIDKTKVANEKIGKPQHSKLQEQASIDDKPLEQHQNSSLSKGVGSPTTIINENCSSGTSHDTLELPSVVQQDAYKEIDDLINKTLNDITERSSPINDTTPTNNHGTNDVINEQQTTVSTKNTNNLDKINDVDNESTQQVSDNCCDKTRIDDQPTSLNKSNEEILENKPNNSVICQSIDNIPPKEDIQPLVKSNSPIISQKESDVIIKDTIGLKESDSYVIEFESDSSVDEVEQERLRLIQERLEREKITRFKKENALYEDKTELNQSIIIDEENETPNESNSLNNSNLENIDEVNTIKEDNQSSPCLLEEVQPQTQENALKNGSSIDSRELINESDKNPNKESQIESGINEDLNIRINNEGKEEDDGNSVVQTNEMYCKTNSPQSFDTSKSLSIDYSSLKKSVESEDDIETQQKLTSKEISNVSHESEHELNTKENIKRESTERVKQEIKEDNEIQEIKENENKFVVNEDYIKNEMFLDRQKKERERLEQQHQLKKLRRFTEQIVEKPPRFELTTSNIMEYPSVDVINHFSDTLKEWTGMNHYDIALEMKTTQLDTEEINKVICKQNNIMVIIITADSYIFGCYVADPIPYPPKKKYKYLTGDHKYFAFSLFNCNHDQPTRFNKKKADKAICVWSHLQQKKLLSAKRFFVLNKTGTSQFSKKFAGDYEGVPSQKHLFFTGLNNFSVAKLLIVKWN
ncbi:protein NUF1 [Entamoeba marina]